MINVKNLSFYRENRVVIDELDLLLEKGELVLLSGSNGGGWNNGNGGPGSATISYYA